MPEENIENISTPDNTFALTMFNSYPLPHAIFGGHRLTNNIYTFKNLINIYIFLTY